MYGPGCWWHGKSGKNRIVVQVFGFKTGVCSATSLCCGGLEPWPRALQGQRGRAPFKSPSHRHVSSSPQKSRSLKTLKLREMLTALRITSSQKVLRWILSVLGENRKLGERRRVSMLKPQSLQSMWMCSLVPEVRSSLPKANMSAVILKDINKKRSSCRVDITWHRTVWVQDVASIAADLHLYKNFFQHWQATTKP